MRLGSFWATRSDVGTWMDRVFVSRERLYAQQSTDDIKSKKTKKI
jgi:hypothetical protein